MALIPYSSFNMSELKLLLKQIDERMNVLQHQRGILQQALEVEKNLKSNNGDDSVFQIQNSRSSQVFPEPEEIEKAILKITGNFKADEAMLAVTGMFPEKQTPPGNAVATVLYQLIKSDKLRYVRERAGRRPAIYHKA
jgi:hypothetical protein